MENITEKTKNTKELRLSIYKTALEVLKKYRTDNFHIGICYGIRTHFTRLGIDCTTDLKKFSPYEYKTIYKELNRFNPFGVNDGKYWFDKNEEGTKKRIKILETIISEMEK